MVLVENPKTLDEKGKLVRLYIYLSDATAIIRSIVFKSPSESYEQ
jgi:hypothetical protein